MSTVVMTRVDRSRERDPRGLWELKGVREGFLEEEASELVLAYTVIIQAKKERVV